MMDWFIVESVMGFRQLLDVAHDSGVGPALVEDGDLNEVF